MADVETGLVFVIAGVEYPMPDVSGLNMAERRVMYDLSGHVQEDFLKEQGEDDEEHEARVLKITRHPGFLESLMHIAYQRGHADLSRKKVQETIDKTNFAEAISKWGEQEQDDAGPPDSESTSEPIGSSPRSNVSRIDSSGNGSTESSEQPEDPQPTTGTSVSDTSFPATPKPTSEISPLAI